MRLHRGGNRQANRVIYLITVGRLKLDPGSQAYRDRKRNQGHSRGDTIRSSNATLHANSTTHSRGTF